MVITIQKASEPIWVTFVLCNVEMLHHLSDDMEAALPQLVKADLWRTTLVTVGTNKGSLKIFKPNGRLPNFPLILFLTFKDCSWTLTFCLGYS